MREETTAKYQASARRRPSDNETSIDTSDRSRSDLIRWAAQLFTQCGLRNEYGFHLMEWSHDEWCALNPMSGPALLTSRCTCEPDGVIVVHAGTAAERRIPVVRDGVDLPVQLPWGQ